jgi:hypothetical protein
LPVASAPARWLLAGLLAWAFGVRLWFASQGLEDGRFADEKFTLDNVASYLTQGSLRPVHLHYPALGSLLHALLLGTADALARWSGRGSQTILRDWSFTPAAYFLARGLQACIGVLTIYWTYRLGRRLLSPRAGLLAALALSAVPIHLQLSAVVKPDILLLLGILIAAEATAAALANERLRDFLGVGMAVGLATAAKYNGVAAALPIAVLALPGARRAPAVLGRLAAAGAVALLVFALIDPFFFIMPDKFQRNFRSTLRHYKIMAAETGEPEGSRLGVVQAALPTIVSPELHGMVTGALGLAGLGLTLAWAARRRDRGLALLTAFPLAYLGLYAAMTNYPKNNNYLPLCPFVALGAAALFGEAGRRLPGRAAPALAAATGLWCATLVWQPMAYAYAEMVPSTLVEAEQTLYGRLSPMAELRVLYQFGTTAEELQLREGRSRALLHQVDRGVNGANGVSGANVDGDELALADAEIFTARALADRLAAGRLARAPAAQVVRIEPRPFHARGEGLTLVLHPWALAAEPLELDEAAPGKAERWTVRPPAGLASPLVVSFEVILPPGSEAPDEIIAGTHRLDLFPGGNHGRRWLTERLRLPELPGEIALTGLPADVEPQLVRLFLWRIANGKVEDRMLE